MLSLAVLLGVGAMLLQIPAVQTFVGHRIVKAISGSSVDACISFGEVKIKPFNTLILKDVVITDPAPYQVDTASLDPFRKNVFRKLEYAPVDTLMSIGNVTATFTLKGLTGSSISLGSAYVRDMVLNLVIEDGENSTNLTRMFKIKEKQYNEIEDKEIFYIRNVEVDGMRFTMKYYRMKCHDIDTSGVNWNNLDISDIHVKGRNLRLRGKVMSGEADFVSFKERSGYSVQNITGRAKAGNGVTLIEDLHLVDQWSDISIPRFELQYEHPWSFRTFVDDVRIVSELEDVGINTMTLSYFAPIFSREDLLLNLKGSVDGTANSFGITGLDLAVGKNLVHGHLEGKLENLADKSKDISASLKLKEMHFSTEGIQDLLDAFGGAAGQSAGNSTGQSGNSTGIGKYAEGVDFILNGSLSGALNNLKFNGYIRSGIGSVVTDLRLANLTNKQRDTEIGGIVRTTDLDLKGIISTVPVRECSMSTGMTVRIPAKDEGMSLKIDSLNISRLNLNDYNYSNIAAVGTVSDNQFDGKIICSDPSLNFMLQGILATSRKTNNSRYRFYANVGHADLYAMNIDRRGPSQVRFQVDANFTRTGTGELLGDMRVADIVLENQTNTYDIGNITMESYTGGGTHQIRLGSKFAEAAFSGSAPIGQFFTDIVNVTAKREDPALFKDSEYEWSGQNYEAYFRTFNTADLLGFIKPGLYIAENTSLNLSLSSDGTLDGDITSQRLAYREHNLKNGHIVLSNADSIFTVEVTGESIGIMSMMLENPDIAISADNNYMLLSLSHKNSGEVRNEGNIMIACEFSRNEDNKMVTDVSLIPSSLYIDDKKWDILPATVKIEGKTYTVRDFALQSDREKISAEGIVSDFLEDTLSVSISEMDIADFNPLLGDGFDLHGKLSGLAQITSPGKPRGILLDFVCDSTGLGGEQIGTLAITSDWDEELQSLVIGVSNDLDGAKTLAVSGRYSMADKSLLMDASLDKFSLGCAAPFLQGLFSETGGTISGDILLSKSGHNTSISSRDVRLEDAQLRVAYTNVAYTVNGPLHIDNNGVYFDDVTIADRRNNTGKISGKIGYDFFKDIYLDTDIDFERLEVVNLDEDVGNGFYGRLFAGGHVDITGPMNAINLSANAITSGSGEFHVPVSSEHVAGSTDLLRFKEEEVIVEIDPYEEMMSRLQEQETKSNELSVNLNVTTTPQVDVWVEIDKESGNILRATGNGQIQLESRPSGNVFSLTGDYNITGGNYHLVVLGLAARDFSINDGSTVRFNGDLMASTLDIGATYRTKASISTLIADTTSTNTRRTVECGIQITGQLSNPRLSFSIDIPDLDPTVKGRVESALSTEDKVQKQFLSLLISNSFIPDEQSGIVNNSSLLLSNVSEMMANQLNNIFQKLDIPIDLGFNYQPTESGNDVFDVAVSTQLFKNKVVVNGNIGNRQYQTSSSQSEVTGDVDIEIKLDRAGSYRLTLFSHSADSYTNYLDDSQRNGVGFAYQQEFNNFKQWLKRAFKSKKKRRQMDAEAAEAQEELVEIKIER